ncbi:hypothetical protein [Halorubrum ezzemoulense]|uniref:hypothetical protein n=1 Tax=Halorubrum ezzemoulense TaxID=337243 RepID=UPI00233059B4|nr:hypothetical protein [Halorubrum ezzemoulense]MDB2237050.1 hypothetical protein [Halorubrum ezzemoulense]
MNLNQILGVLFMFLLAFSGMALPSAAADDCGVLSDLLGDCDDENDDGLFNAVKAGVSGLIDRATYSVAGGTDTTAQEQADKVQATFNADSNTIASYADSRITPTDDYDVIRLEFVDDSGDKASKYLVTTIDSNNDIAAVEMVDSTDQSIDAYLSIEGYAFEQSETELDRFITNYVDEDKTPQKSYLINKAAKFDGDISGTLLRELSG